MIPTWETHPYSTVFLILWWFYLKLYSVPYAHTPIIYVFKLSSQNIKYPNYHHRSKNFLTHFSCHVQPHWPESLSWSCPGEQWWFWPQLPPWPPPGGRWEPAQCGNPPANHQPFSTLKVELVTALMIWFTNNLSASWVIFQNSLHCNNCTTANDAKEQLI